MTNPETSETCLLCIPIRKGVLFLIFVGFVLNTMSAVWAWTVAGSLLFERPVADNSNASVIAVYNSAILSVSIAAAVYSVCALFALWGGWAAYKRRASHFKVFTIIYAILTAITLILLIWNPAASSIVTSVLSIYWTYVYFTYWKIINGKAKEAITTHPQEGTERGAEGGAAAEAPKETA
ncbi:hypothetical protein BCR44DRAFT_297842 [Catenaria anguillulae PL171]|uniref:Uncharacterized protein n=1 Tax=Catenaria anguillulae PL171 TaxID=765915 RepID=A0A1Y2H7Y1_9FUNG|nr:hypothetical protein BCR44DRAFT_297842 [Catenaria anguillulae PL171]